MWKRSVPSRPVQSTGSGVSIRGFMDKRANLPLVSLTSPWYFSLASDFPDLTLALWGYPLLVGVVGSSMGALSLSLVRRRSSPLVWLAGWLSSTLLGYFAFWPCMDVTRELFSGLCLWTVLISFCGAGLVYCGPSRGLALPSDQFRSLPRSGHLDGCDGISQFDQERTSYES